MAALSQDEIFELRDCFRKRMGVNETARKLGLLPRTVSRRFQSFRDAYVPPSDYLASARRPITLPKLKYMEGWDG